MEQTNQNSLLSSDKLPKADILMSDGFSVAFQAVGGKRLEVNSSDRSILSSFILYLNSFSVVISLGTETLRTCCKATLPMMMLGNTLESTLHMLSCSVCVCVCAELEVTICEWGVMD